jgi:PAS domain S-box-containing protein
LITPKELALDALEASLDGIVLADADHQFLYVNKSFANLFGYTGPDEALTLQGADLWVRPEEARAVAIGLENGRPFNGETIGRRRDGAEVHLRLWATPILDKTTGRFLGSISSMQDVTDRHMAEHKLMASEAMLRAIVDKAPVGIVGSSPEGVIEFVNPEAVRIFGRPGDALLGANVATLYDEPLRSDLSRQIEAYRQRAEPQIMDRSAFPAMARQTDGTVIPVELSLTNYVDDLGEHFLGAVLDVSARKLAERSLTVAQAALSASLDAIILLDLQGRITWANDSFLSMYGFETLDDAIGRVSRDLWARSEDADQAVEQFIEAGIWRGEGEGRRRDGGRFWAQISGTLVKDPETGEPLAWMSAIRDITEQRRAADALRDREARLANAQRIAHLGDWEFDPRTGRFKFSDELYRLLKRPKEAGDSSLDFASGIIDKEDYPAVHEAIQRSLASPDAPPYSVDYRAHLPDGSMRFFHSQGEVLFDDAGNALKFSGTVQDITERKIAEEKLRQAQKMETVGQLTGGVAHDFNNLLMAMQLNLELARDRSTDKARADELMGAALHAVQRAAELTGMLLAFSRQQPLQPKPCNVNALIAGAMRLLDRTLEKKVRVETRLSPQVWPVEIDPGQFENALINLAVNARDAMPDGGVLSIETGNTTLDRGNAGEDLDVPAGEYVMVAISDTGTGMPPEVLERVFEPFFTTKEIGKGTGLGLSMVYGFVKQSGGHIQAFSQPGAGATFKLYFPRRQSQVEPARKKNAAKPAASRGETILLVEDDRDVRGTVQAILAVLGYEVHAVPDGPAAMDLIAGGLEPDVLLADIMLPRGMTGADVARAVRDRVPRCRILLMSGYTSDVVVHHGRLDPDVMLLSKPFSRDVLAAKLREILDGA